jgi:hypothetical protein
VIDLGDQFDSMDELESIVRAAGDVVFASEDLRPRVLEMARQQMRERRARRWARRLAMGVVALTTLTASNSSPDARRPLAAALAYPVGFSTDGVRNASGIDPDWGMVDGFTEMRRLQAEVLRATL